MTFDNHGMASTLAVTIPCESPQKVESLAVFELEARTINNWLRAVMHRHRYVSLHTAIVIFQTNVRCYCTFGISEEDKGKVSRVLEMQVNNLDRKRKEIDQKIEQFESEMIDHLNSVSGRYYRRRLANSNN